MKVREARENSSADLPGRAAATRTARYARFVAVAVAIVLGLAAIGFQPTRRLAGEAALGSMAAGCIVGLVSAGLAGLLLVLVDAETPVARMQRAFLAMAIRLAAAVLLALAAGLTGEFETRPLLIWIAVTYLALLP